MGLSRSSWWLVLITLKIFSNLDDSMTFFFFFFYLAPELVRESKFKSSQITNQMPIYIRFLCVRFIHRVGLHLWGWILPTEFWCLEFCSLEAFAHSLGLSYCVVMYAMYTPYVGVYHKKTSTRRGHRKPGNLSQKHCYWQSFISMLRDVSKNPA